MNIIRSTWLIKTKQIAVLLKRTIHLYLTVPSQIKMLSLPSSFKNSVLISGAWNFRRTKIITSYVSSKFQLFILLNIVVHCFVCIISKLRGIWMGLYFFIWKQFLASVFLILFLISKGSLSLFSLVCVNHIRLYFCACERLLFFVLRIVSCICIRSCLQLNCDTFPAHSPADVPCYWPCPWVLSCQE